MKKIFAGIFMALSCLLLVGTAYADVDGIPYNPNFPKAQYPYSQAPDACSGVTDRPDSNGEIKDNWAQVNFRGACNTHDKCYYTLGSDWNSCNNRLYSDLRAACERDLSILTRFGRLPPDPVSLTACYAIATTYYAGVQGGVAAGVFDKAQSKQRKYEEWISSIRKTENSVNSVNSESSGNIINKIALRADNGQYLARCDGCIPRTSYSNIAFIHADNKETPYAQWDLIKLDNEKYALRADNGMYMARCDGCIPRAAYPNSAFIHAQTTTASPAQWDLIKLDNGKYALRADNGSYLARCDGCAPNAAYPNIAFIHAADSSSRYAQWDMIIID